MQMNKDEIFKSADALVNNEEVTDHPMIQLAKKTAHGVIDEMYEDMDPLSALAGLQVVAAISGVVGKAAPERDLIDHLNSGLLATTLALIERIEDE